MAYGVCMRTHRSLASIPFHGRVHAWFWVYPGQSGKNYDTMRSASPRLLVGRRSLSSSGSGRQRRLWRH